LKLSIGFSPCPNDTFIFDALVNNKIDTGDLQFGPVLEDVETLNRWAIEGKLDITKLSYGVLPLVLDRYVLLNSGSALGTGVGPLLISNRQWAMGNGKEKVGSSKLVVGSEEVNNSTIAIPGEHTTAHLLFSLAYPDAKNKIFLRYDQIEDFVLSRKGLGVIIHENRFTYSEKGLHKITDLGDYWEKQTGGPIPLGGIVIKKHLDAGLQEKINSLIGKSIEYAYSNYPQLNDYIRRHSQEMSEEVMRKHIDLYVNNYSIDLGEEGRAAVKKLLEVYQQVATNKL
jgi:1,4-dihydroxy-6-naphthoate synthase